MNQLLSVTETPIGAAEFVASCGTIVATFDRSQDSGNVSWIVATETGEFFAKSAGTTAPVAAGSPVPYFDHAGRVRLLRNAVEVAGSCDHRSLARLRNVVETSDGPVLVYERAPGELIATPRVRRADPDSPYRRFAALPAERHVPIISELFDAHVALAAAGWIACDLYDGCLIVDFFEVRRGVGLKVVNMGCRYRVVELGSVVAEATGSGRVNGAGDCLLDLGRRQWCEIVECVILRGGTARACWRCVSEGPGDPSIRFGADRHVDGGCQNGMIFETVLELGLVTQMLVPSKTTPNGLVPTGMVVVTVLVVGLILDTVFEE